MRQIMPTKFLLALLLVAALPPVLASAQNTSKEDPAQRKPAANEQAPSPGTQPLDRSSPEATLDLMRRMQRARDSTTPTTTDR
jgi:hypothetical protein